MQRFSFSFRLRILVLRFNQNWQFAVGISPQREEIFVSLACSCGIAAQRDRSRQPHGCKRIQRRHKKVSLAFVVEYLSELDRSLCSLAQTQVRQTAQVLWLKVGGGFVTRGRLQKLNCPRRVVGFRNRRVLCPGTDYGRSPSLQLFVLFLCFDQNGHVRVCIFPECEEILIGFACFRRVAAQGCGARQPQMRERV